MSLTIVYISICPKLKDVEASFYTTLESQGRLAVTCQVTQSHAWYAWSYIK